MTPAQHVAIARESHPLAPASASLAEQRQALHRRQQALTNLWSWHHGVKDEFFYGFWEEDEGFWCFCADAPNGHFSGDHGCLFGDGQELGWMCPDCRRPARVSVSHGRSYQGDYGSAPAYEHWTRIETACCEAEPVLPNGTAGEIDDV